MAARHFQSSYDRHNSRKLYRKKQREMKLYQELAIAAALILPYLLIQFF